MDMTTHLWAPWVTIIIYKHYLHPSRVGPDIVKVEQTEMAITGELRVVQDHPHHLHDVHQLIWIHLYT
jgi:hypothetical protein